MNDTINREESAFATAMAAVGLVVMIVLLAWLAVQLVRFIPTIFSRLADVFEENQEELDRRLGDDNVVIVGETEGTNETDSESEADGETPEDEEKPEVPEADKEETPVAPDNKPTPAPAPQPAPVQYRTVTTYQVPVSNPNGFTDLAISFVAVGEMTSAERFLPSSHLSEDGRSAMQFKVKNIGTKTSGEWRFVAELPDGSTITSLPQRSLKPSETSTITLAFDGVEGKKDRVIGATLSAYGDTNIANNGFKVSVDVK